jgi:hypothetical protein
MGKISTTQGSASMQNVNVNSVNVRTVNPAAVNLSVNRVNQSGICAVTQSVFATGNQSIVNVGTAGKQPTGSSPTLIGGQLKVTSQGLIKVQGYSPLQNKATKINSTEQNASLLNGGIISNVSTENSMVHKQQPLILVPTSTGNKVGVLPCKGKSLLNKSINNVKVSQTNGGVILLNQSNIVAANGEVGKITFSTQGIAKISSPSISLSAKSPSAIVGTAGSKPMKILQTGQQNQLIIIPVTSHSTVAMATKCQSNLTVENSAPSDLINGSVKMENKSDPKSVLAVQNNLTSKIGIIDHSQNLKSMTSLLGSRSGQPILTLTSNPGETPITITSSDKKEKKIIVVNEDNYFGSLDDKAPVDSFHGNISHPFEKKIMLDPKRKRLTKLQEGSKNQEGKEKEIINPLR